MKRYINNIIILLAAFIIGGPALTSCEDIDEISDMKLDRVLSPVNLSTRISNKVNLVISWTLSSNAEQYVIEIYTGATIEENAVPVKTYTIGSNEIPYTISGLDGETEYSVRVKGIVSDGSIADSKWSSATFKTDAEQIFYNVELEDIEATQVTLRWPAGEYAETIVLTPGDIVHNVTPEEIAAGVAVVTGLSGETSYTAKLMNGEKTRGTATFITPVNVGDAILIENNEAFLAALSNLEGGETLALVEGTYTGADESRNFNIGKSVSIVTAKSGGKVILNGHIRLNAGAGLSLTNIILDGTNGSGDQAIIFQDNGANGIINIEGCEIKNYIKGVFYINKATEVEKMTFNNCIFHDITSSNDFFDCRAGVIKEFTLSNSTVYNSCASREFVRMDKNTNFPTISSIVVNITNNTIVGVSGSGRRLLYIRYKNNSINFTKNIVYGTKGVFNDNSDYSKPVFESNNYFDSPGLVATADKSKYFDDSSTKYELDPQFSNADNGDFTVGNAELKDLGIGDPRWLQ